MPRVPHVAPWALAGVLALAGSILVSTAAAEAPAERQPKAVVGGAPTTDEHTLASRLLAPCCWSQTLDVHTSDVALDLRREIRSRLASGEAPATIEADLVARYGDRIRAVPTESPLGRVAAGTLVLVAIAGLGILLLGLRWRRRARRGDAERNHAAGGPETDPAGRDAWDDRLDAELREL